MAKKPLSTSRVYTISPLRTPFSTNSELSGEHEADALFSSVKNVDWPTKLFTACETDWPFGYGTTEHDAITWFFRPFSILHLNELPGLDNYTGACAAAYQGGELHLYDDGLGVLFARWDEKTLQTVENIDATLDSYACQLYDDFVRPELAAALSQIEKRTNAAFSILERPSRYRVFTPLSNMPHEPFWNARAVLVSANTGNKGRWNKWIDKQSEPHLAVKDFKSIVTSGNSYFESHEADVLRLELNFLRSMSFCQFHAVLMSRYQNVLRDGLRDIQRSRKKSGKKAELELMETRINHLEFVNLQHERSRYGLQGARRAMVDEIENVWEAQAQAQNTWSWANLLHKRVEREYHRRLTVQTRIIRALVALIGGLTLIELAFTLLDAGNQYREDHVPGVLDVIAGLPADIVLYGTLVLVVLLGFLAFKNDE